MNRKKKPATVWLERGLIYATAEDAIARSKATLEVEEK